MIVVPAGAYDEGRTLADHPIEFRLTARIHGGALGGIYSSPVGVYGKAAERLHGFLRPPDEEKH